MRSFSHREEITDRRSFIYNDLTSELSDPMEGYTGSQPEFSSAKADGSPGSRVLFLHTTDQGRAGLDDVILKLKILLSVARSIQAVPAVAGPDQLLGRPDEKRQLGQAGHSWDTYIETSPKLVSLENARCAPGMEVTEIRDLASPSPQVLAQMRDTSKPLCMQLRFLIFELRPDWSSFAGKPLARDIYSQLVRPSWAHTQLWRSSKTSSLVAQVKRMLPHFGINYNSLHARRGDLASNCTSPKRSVERMLKVDRNGVWVIMSNADDEWFLELKELALANGLRMVTEKDLTALQMIQDPFLKYSVVQCLFASGVHRVNSHKSLVSFCHPPGGRSKDGDDAQLCKVTTILGEQGAANDYVLTDAHKKKRTTIKQRLVVNDLRKTNST